ncbi:MAG: DMT family transporter [Desulfuromonadaceae bacterium]|nr:DMT family transporter [Desulfuromonadaceae bacterium]
MRVKVSPYILLILTTLFWAGNFVLGRAVNTVIPPITLSFWRWALAFLILLPFSIQHLISQRLLIRKSWKNLIYFGILGVSCFNTFVYIGLHSTTATNALLLNSIIPVLIVIISRIFAKVPVSRAQAAGILMSLAGVVTIICRADIGRLLALRVNGGDLWVLLAVICWAIHSFRLRLRSAELHPLSFLSAIIAIGLVFIFPVYLWEISRGGRVTLDLVSCGSMLYVAVFPSLLAYLFWNHAVVELGPNKAGLFIHLMPVFGTILSIMFLGESLQLFHVAGICLISLGIYLTTATRRNQPASG